MPLQSQQQRPVLYYRMQSKIKHIIPNVITSLRLVALPHLVYSFNHEIAIAVYALFLFSISTDLVDGYVARKLQSTSKLGAYFDLTVDFLFISGMFLTFINKELYPPWILITMLFVFSQFILTNLYAKRTVYDPIGKYYGSFLFGGIGLTLLFPDPLVYQVVTIGIVVVSVGSLLSRLIFFLKGSY